jgi:translin
MDLNDILDKIKEELDEKDRRREEVFALAREIRRFSTRAIREVHNENYDSAEILLDDIKNMVSDIGESDKPFTFIQDALQEYAEASLTYAFLRKIPPPPPENLGIASEAYLLGLSDTIGEIRRHIFDEIRNDHYDEVEKYLDLMDELYHGIMAFDYPSAVLPIKRKQDIARLLLEKTRGEVTLVLKQMTLEKKLEDAKGEVEQQRSG